MLDRIANEVGSECGLRTQVSENISALWREVGSQS